MATIKDEKRRKKLLFVTRGDNKDYREGFSYVLELSKTFHGGILILAVYDKSIINSFEDEMASAAFAEMGEFSTAREILHGQYQRMEKDAEQKVAALIKDYKNPSIEIGYEVAVGDVTSNIKAINEKNPAIEVTLLSPNLNKNVDIKKLLKQVSRPIVAMSKPAAT